jgi:hypothetical protein
MLSCPRLRAVQEQFKVERAQDTHVGGAATPERARLSSLKSGAPGLLVAIFVLGPTRKCA